jgi:cell division protein FtsW (lipid II flippase)
MATPQHSKKRSWWLALPGTLTVLAGIAILIQQDLPRSLWGMNALGLVLGLLGFGLGFYVLHVSGKGAFLGACVCLLCLLLPFFFSGQEGIYRWISWKSFHVHVGSIVLPLLLILLDHFLRRASTRGVAIIAFLTVAALGMQPDAAQLTAFSAGILTILFLRREPFARWLLLLSVGAALIVWIWGDNLADVNYVEGIVGLAWGLSKAGGVTAVVLLLTLPLPFFGVGIAENETLYMALGVYFSVVLLCGWLGHFPLPLLSYGISPIIGYFWALGVLRQRKE